MVEKYNKQKNIYFFKTHLSFLKWNLGKKDILKKYLKPYNMI